MYSLEKWVQNFATPQYRIELVLYLGAVETFGVVVPGEVAMCL